MPPCRHHPPLLDMSRSFVIASLVSKRFFLDERQPDLGNLACPSRRCRDASPWFNDDGMHGHEYFVVVPYAWRGILDFMTPHDASNLLLTSLAACRNLHGMYGVHVM